MKISHGIGASRGVAVGPVFQFRRANLDVERHPVEDAKAEMARLRAALKKATTQLEMIHQKAAVESGADQAAIFEAQMMMLEDPELVGSVTNAIEKEGINAEAALHEAAEAYATSLESLEDEYLRARAADVRDVAARALRILLGIAESPTEALVEPSIVVATDLTPSDTVLLDKTCVLGFCTARGGYRLSV